MNFSNIIFFINRHAFFFGIILSVFYNLPYLILWENAVYNIGDCLDGLPVIHSTVKSEYFFSFGNNNFLEAYLGGAIPRNALTPGPLNIMNMGHYIFEPLSAFVFNKLISTIIGFIGMFLFLRDNILLRFNQRVLCLIIALTFSCLPLKAHFGCGVFTITPLVFYSFIKISDNKDILINLGILFFSSFAGSIVYNSVFILFYLIIYWISRCMRAKNIKYLPLFGIFIFLVGVVLCDLNILILHFLDNEFVGHRTLNPITSSDIQSIFFNFSSFFFNEKYAHVVTLHHVIILWLFVLGIFWKKVEKRNLQKVVLFLGIIIFNTLFATLLSWEIFDPIKKKINILGSFGFYRFTWLNPFFWWVLFACIVKCFFQLMTMRNCKTKTPILLVMLCTSGILYVVKNSWEYRSNLTLLLKNSEHSYNSNTLSFKDFYSEPLFESIKEYIGRDQAVYKVGSVGLHPAVPRYNGFHTIDGYYPIYSLDYKTRFREIIIDELNKVPKLKLKFDNWGNRCYLFSSELYKKWNHKDYIISKHRNLKLVNLDFKFDKLKSLDCDYIFSTVKIEKHNQNELSYIKNFEMNDLPYKIFLYEVL